MVERQFAAGAGGDSFHLRKRAVQLLRYGAVDADNGYFLVLLSVQQMSGKLAPSRPGLALDIHTASRPSAAITAFRISVISFSAFLKSSGSYHSPKFAARLT